MNPSVTTLWGCDFSSAPTRRKPITLAVGRAERGRVLLDGMQTFETLDAWGEQLHAPGPWVGGFDLPFGLPHELVTALGWTLLHFLWQGLLTGLATALLLHILRAAPAQSRHLAACLGLLACLASPAINLARSWPAASGVVVQAQTTEITSRRSRDHLPASQGRLEPSLAAALRPALPWVVGIWLAGAFSLLLRLGSGWTWLRHLRRSGSSPASLEWQRQLDS